MIWFSNRDRLQNADSSSHVTSGNRKSNKCGSADNIRTPPPNLFHIVFDHLVAILYIGWRQNLPLLVFGHPKTGGQVRLPAADIFLQTFRRLSLPPNIFHFCSGFGGSASRGAPPDHNFVERNVQNVLKFLFCWKHAKVSPFYPFKPVFDSQDIILIFRLPLYFSFLQDFSGVRFPGPTISSQTSGFR